MDLEIKLVEVLALTLRASSLADKYRTSISMQETISRQETDREILAEDAEVLLLEAAAYSHNNSKSSIREPVV
jgi:hypothetical protein